MKKIISSCVAVMLLTGFLGFYPGMQFDGIGIVRVLFVVAVDLLIVSFLHRLFFTDKKEAQAVKVKKNNNNILQ